MKSSETHLIKKVCLGLFVQTERLQSASVCSSIIKNGHWSHKPDILRLLHLYYHISAWSLVSLLSGSCVCSDKVQGKTKAKESFLSCFLQGCFQLESRSQEIILRFTALLHNKEQELYTKTSLMHLM